MVHCGGIGQRSTVLETTLEVDRRVMEVDYFGTLALTRHCCPILWNEKQAIRRCDEFDGAVLVSFAIRILRSKARTAWIFESLRAEHDDGIGVTMVAQVSSTQHQHERLVGDGSQQGTMDAKTGAGLSPEECAAKMVRAVERRKPEVLIGRFEIVGAYLKRFAPGLMRRIVRKAAVT